MAHGRHIQSLQVRAAEAGHGGALRRGGVLREQASVRRKLAQARTFVHRDPVVALDIHRRTVRSAAVTVIAELPAWRLGFELRKLPVGAQAVGLQIKVPRIHTVLRRIRPVRHGVIGAEAHAIASQRAAELVRDVRGRARLAGVHGVERGGMLGFGLVNRTDPKTTQRITLAVIGTYGGGVIRKRSDLRQRAAPLLRPENAMPQGDHQTTAARRGDATGL